MNSLFETNQKALRERYPLWADLVLAWANQTASITIPVDESPAAPLQIERPHMHLVFGLGSGGPLKALIQADPQGRFLLVEADPQLFCETLKQTDLSEAIRNPHVHWLVGRPAEHLKMAYVEVLRLGDNSNYLPNARIQSDASLTSEHVAYYQKAASSFNAAVKHFWDLNVGNSVEDLGIGLGNFLSNLSKLSRCAGIIPYQNQFNDRVGVVVSSGPSLNLSLEALKSLGDRAVVICADSALKTLLKHGIKPFGVATMERDAEIPKLFTGFEIPKDVVYFTTPYIQQDLFESYPGPLAPFFPRLKQFEWLPELLPPVNTGACCAHLAFQTLCYLGCREIALVGQDFAFDPHTGESYFAGARQENIEFERTHQRYEVPNNNGATIVTHYWWMLYRDIFEAMIRERTIPVTNVIPKSHGVKIQSARHEEPAVFFQRMALEKNGGLPRDMAQGVVWLHERLPQFQAELKAKRNHMAAEILRFQKGLLALAPTREAAVYFASVRKLRECLDGEAARLIDEFWSPRAKRFDAAAQSVWTQAEFCEHFPPYLEAWLASLETLAAILNPLNALAQQETAQC